MYGDDVWKAMIYLAIAAMIAAFGLGMLAMWGLPKLWELVKPLLHALTA